MAERLDKCLAADGGCSRREARERIAKGRVRVNGRVVTRPEEKCAPEDEITVDGVPLSRERFVYLLLHKPPGVVCSTRDPEHPTVLSLLPPEYRRRGLFPVGRLDKDTTGLLLLTDDGALAHRLLSPKHHVEKVYLAEVDGCVDAADVQAFAEGMLLGNGERCLPARLLPEGAGRRCRIVLQEGKYHQVRRMLAARGKPVLQLKRLSMGELRLPPELAPGDWRPLSERERESLRAREE